MGGFTPLSCVLPLPHNPRSKSLNLDNLPRVFVVWVYNKIILEGKGTKVDSSPGAHSDSDLSADFGYGYPPNRYGSDTNTLL